MCTLRFSRFNKAYILGMYVNDSNTKVCQMCKKPVERIDTTEIANYGIPRLSDEVESTITEPLVASEGEKWKGIITAEDFVIKEEIHDEEKEEKQEEFQQEVTKTVFMPNTQPIKEGNLVFYKKMNTLEIVDAVMDTSKYLFHESFIGKKIGDIIIANGKRFIVVSIL